MRGARFCQNGTESDSPVVSIMLNVTAVLENGWMDGWTVGETQKTCSCLGHFFLDRY